MTPRKSILAEVCNVPTLSSDEQIRCVQHIRAGDQYSKSSKDRLGEGNLHLVVSIAQRYQNDRIHILDLIQKGNEGLLVALETFTDSGEDDFSIHAATHIKRAIEEAVASCDSTRP